MTDRDIEKIISLNQTLCMLLGYASSILDYIQIHSMTQENRVKVEWLNSAIENVVYLNRPLPPKP
jgi:diacylglycerol kinase